MTPIENVASKFWKIQLTNTKHSDVKKKLKANNTNTPNFSFFILIKRTKIHPSTMKFGTAKNCVPVGVADVVQRDSPYPLLVTAARRRQRPVAPHSPKDGMSYISENVIYQTPSKTSDSQRIFQNPQFHYNNHQGHLPQHAQYPGSKAH